MVYRLVVIKTFESVVDLEEIENTKEGELISGRVKHKFIAECFGFLSEGLRTFIIYEYCEVEYIFNI